MAIRKGILLTLVLLVIVGCATTGPGGKKDLIIISDAQEVSLGAEFDQQVRQENKILDNQQWQDYFNEVGQKIVAVCDRKDIEYHFTVIQSEDLNAFATPGGYVYIYSGLLKLMQSEAELAAVTAHEISHVVARHGVKNLQQALGLSILLDIISGKTDNQTLMAALNIGITAGMAGYSRSYEREADNFGIQYMTAAGYNPNGAIDMFEKLASVDGGDRSVFENMFASHPETNERIENAQNEVSGMNPEVIRRDIGASKYQQLKNSLP